MTGLVRIACAAGATLIRWVACAPIGCGATLLAWAGALDRKAQPPPSADA